MKHLPLALLLLTGSALAAQKNFEGVIRYRMASRDSTIRVNITAWFKKDKILFTTTPQQAPPGSDLKNETILLDFSKAAIDRYKPQEKKVERESMTGSGKKQDIPALKVAPAAGKSILGHPCTAFTSGAFSKTEKKDSALVTTAGEIIFWYADDLVFRVPDSLLMIQMVPLFTNNHVALGSEIKVAQGNMQLLLRTEATEIQAKKLRPSLFRHPKGYSLSHNE